MKINKRFAGRILSTAAALAMLTGMLPGQYIIGASAAEVVSLSSETDGVYTFLANGNPASTRERIAAVYDPVFTAFYDKMQSGLTDQTMNNHEKTTWFRISIDVSGYRYQKSSDPKGNNDICYQLMYFAQNVLEDSPQFYWTNSHDYTEQKVGSDGKPYTANYGKNSVKMSWSASGGYYTTLNFDFIIDESLRDWSARDAANKKLNTAVESYRAVIKDKTGIPAKLRAVNDKMIVDTYYDVAGNVSGESPLSQSAYGCLVNKKCVCNGYAKGFQLVCNALGITETVRISGQFRSNSSSDYQSHSWNACKVLGGWYFMDVTSNDPLINKAGGNEFNDPEKYTLYFLFGTDSLKEHHKIEDTLVPYPVFEKNDYSEPVFSLNTVVIDGTIYYVINSAADLREFSQMMDYCTVCPNAVLTSDIDLGGAAFTPLGSSERPFTGIFDGEGHTVSGLNVQCDDSPAGLIGAADGAEIKNVTVSSGIVNGSTEDEQLGCGAIVGSAVNGTVIENCHNTGVSVNGCAAGGIVGCTSGNGVSIEDCTNSGTVTAYSCGGGIAGSAGEDTEITDCSNTGTTVRNNSAAQEVCVGGIAGICSADISGCSNTGTLSGDTAGGIIGVSQGESVTISDCLSGGTIRDGAETSGSFVGRLDSDIQITNSLSNVPYDLTGSANGNTLTAENVCMTAYESETDGASYCGDAQPGFIAYTLGWGQVIGQDASPVPGEPDEDNRVYRLEYTGPDGETVTAYFNQPFDPALITEELPEGWAWIMDGTAAEPSSLAGTGEDITLTAQRLRAYISGFAYMTLDDSMSYCFLIGADDDIIEQTKEGSCPLGFSARINGAAAASGTAQELEYDGRTYISFAVDIPVRCLGDELSCELSYENNGKTVTVTSGGRSAAEYLTSIANDNQQEEAVRNTAAAMLNYCAAVQEYKNYGTDKPANAGLSDEQKQTARVTKDEIQTADPVFDLGCADISLRAVTVDMLSRISLRAYYKLNGSAANAYDRNELIFSYKAPDGTSAEVKIGMDVENTGICGRANGFIWVEIPGGISPADYGTQAEFHLNTKDMTGDSMSYSVLNYISDVCGSESGMAEVASALYRYWQAVNAMEASEA